MLKDLIRKNRSYRRFYQDQHIPEELLYEMIDNARLSASARNAQPLKYIIVSDREMNEQVFSCTAWAGYLKDWPGPAEGERPSAYIIQLNDTRISTKYFCDDGIAAQSILLTATEQGFGGCIIASVKREKLSKLLDIPEHLMIIQAIALGKPREKVVIDPVEDNNIEYWRDNQDVHHVPKRSLDEIIWKKF